MQKLDITHFNITSMGYPRGFTHLHKPPANLYMKGNTSLLNNQSGRPMLGVVGTRRATTYGKTVILDLVRTAARNGVVIVSGLAYGIDSLAHRAALEVGGSTVAVLPGSLSYIYPVSHSRLADEIVSSGGLLLSEYNNRLPPMKHHFIERNRLIAALCDTLLVVEAAEKSGSFHTVRFALELGKNVCAVPGNITSTQSQGVNRLIKEGSEPILSSDDLLNFLGINELLMKPRYKPQNAVEQHIVESLERDHMTTTEILNEANRGDDGEVTTTTTSMAPSTLNIHLTVLELRGVIENNNSKWQLAK